MIRKLRKKFIVAAIIAVFLVLAVLIGAINVLNYRSLVSDADGTLQILAENRGAFPRQMFREQDRPTEPLPPPTDEREGSWPISPGISPPGLPTEAVLPGSIWTTSPR